MSEEIEFPREYNEDFEVSPQRLHEAAMEECDKADDCKRLGDLEGERKHRMNAFRLEKDAAGLVALESNCEPTRSILFRSAAWCAYEVGEFQEAEILAARALSKKDASEKDKLREVLQAAWKAMDDGL